MSLTLREIVDAFERLSIDDRLHLVLPSLEELDVCIQFDRQDQLRCWTFYFREAKDESSQQCSRAHFVEVARAFHLDESLLSKELASHLLTQAAFADQFVREVQDLLGEDAVRESIVRTQLFMDALKDAVSSALETRPQPTASADEQEASKTPHHPAGGQTLKFRVIKGS